MLINKLYQQQRFLSVLLTLGMLLQLAVPLLDGSLVYRFSNWLTHESSLEIAHIQQLRNQAHSIEELAVAVANSANELPESSGEEATSAPKADFFLQSFLAQTDAQRATKEAATTNNAPIKPQSLLATKVAIILGGNIYGTLQDYKVNFGSLVVLFDLRQKALSSLGDFSFPPVSGQSTLAP